MAIIAILIARLLDPILIVLAIIGAFISRAWWHVALAAFAAAAIVEILLSAIQVVRAFNPIIFLIGVVAAGVWVALAFWVRQAWRNRSKDRQRS